MQPVLQPTDLIGNARWYVHQVRVSGQAEVVAMTPEAYAASSFLDHRIRLPENAQVRRIDFNALHPHFQDVAPCETRFIFHISHVGSTLLSKAIGKLGGVLAYREPMMLRWLSEIRSNLTLPESRYNAHAYTVMLRTALGLLARPLGDQHKSVVKASSFASNLADDILTLQPKSRAVGIYCRFESFAATVMNGRGGWDDMLAQAPVRMRRLHGMLGRQPWQLARLSAGEIVALNWLCEMLTLSRAQRRHADRFTWFDFDHFLHHCDGDFVRLAQALGLECGAAEVAALHDSGVLNAYSKDERVTYDAATRAQIKRDVAMRHESEILRGRAWLDRALADHPELRELQLFTADVEDIAA